MEDWKYGSTKTQTVNRQLSTVNRQMIHPNSKQIITITGEGNLL
jgi:hypothetical protein